MSKNVRWGSLLVALSAAVLLLTPSLSHAQRRGWGWGPGGYDPWGYHSGGASSGGTTAGTTTFSNLQYYPSTSGLDSRTAGFTIRLPDAKADVWFESTATKQQGIIRQYVSENLDPGYTYTYHVRVRWMDNGNPVEKTRDVEVRAGQQVNLDFTK